MLTNEDKRRYILNVLFLASVLATIALSLYCVNAIIPFIFGFIVAFILKPVTLFISNWTGFKRKGSAIFVMSLFYIAIFFVAWFVGVLIVTKISNLFSILPQLYASKIEPELQGFTDYFLRLVSELSPDVSNVINTVFQNITSSISSALSNISQLIIGGVTGVAKNIPLYVLTVIFSIVSSILISVDYQKVTTFFLRQFSPKGQKIILEGKTFLINSVFKMFKAYMIILFVTFIELAIGLLMLKADYAVPVAAITAVLDIFPFIGTGAVMIPWGIYSIVANKNLTMGIGLLILYAVITIVRNIIEPRIVGKSIGLHPLVTITSMYAGLKLFGFLGMFLAPITVLLIKHLNETELIHLYKE